MLDTNCSEIEEVLHIRNFLGIVFLGHVGHRGVACVRGEVWGQ